MPPYHPNIGKRLVQSPKVYWRDSGLLHGLLNVPSLDDLLSHPWIGASWEGWVVEQALIHMNNTDIPYDGPYFFRTSDGRELDLVLAISGKVWAVEEKLNSMPGRGDLKRLNRPGGFS